MTFATHISRGPSLAKTGAALALAIAVLGIGACKSDEGQGTQVAGWTLVDPEQRHPIMVSQEPAILNLHVPRGSQGLTSQQRAEVVEFTSRYRAGDAGNSRLVVSVPSGSANEVAAIGAAEDVRELLFDGGFPESAVSVEAYHDEGGAQPPIRIAYMRYVAKGPDCGNDWSENLARNARNIGHPNFGCANQRNLASMIVNPADLLGPRTMGERYSDRRDTVMDAWSKGKTTGAEKSEDERVRVKGAQ
ncbi:MAG: CpaD family pilus assembly protein [Hyphomicrobium sp.]|nr:CpaD family pilus assembly protein [Hyphomicrobium sp.]